MQQHKFFEEFQESETHFDANSLYVFAVMTATEGFEVRAGQIFDWYDKDVDGTLPKSTVIQLLGLFSTLSTKYLSKIAIGTLSEDKIKTYSAELEKRRSQWVTDKTKKLSTETISREDFVKNFSYLSSTKNIRTDIEMVKPNVAKFMSAFDNFAKTLT